MTTAAMTRPPIDDDRIDVGEELRTIGMVWRRELIRFSRTRTRIIGGFAQPTLFLFVLGYGLSPLIGTTGGFDFKKFVFPGVVAMSVVTTGAPIFSARISSSFDAFDRMTPPPTYRTGRSASNNSCAAAWICLPWAFVTGR